MAHALAGAKRLGGAAKVNGTVAGLPHGGIAFGWERIVALLAGSDSIRDVIATCKSGGGFDRLISASASDTPEQRKAASVDAAPGEPDVLIPDARRCPDRYASVTVREINVT